MTNPYKDYSDNFAKTPVHELGQTYRIGDKDWMQIESVSTLASEVRDLRMMVRFLYSKLEEMEDQLPKSVEAVVSTEENVPITKAKLMIHEYLSELFKEGKKVYPSDVADALGLSYETVRKVFDVFESEGRLKECK
jgi:lipoate-protein ligase A